MAAAAFQVRTQLNRLRYPARLGGPVTRCMGVPPSPRRRYASSSLFSDVKPVELAYDSYIPPSGNKTHGPLVILHGFLGSKRNWQSLCKALMQDLGRPVYALDLRNHGHSPHASPMTYPALATDVVSFLREHRLADVQLLGHSMGGKVAMALALAEPDALQKLVVADIAPSVGSISPEFTEYVRAMRRVQGRKLRTRKEAQEAMRETESDPAVLAFLMTNLVSADDGMVHFRLPLDILEESVGHIGDFPIAPGERLWDGPTLFVKGSKSNYINRKNLPIAEQLFPNMKVETLEAGHWVHAERPHEFKQLLVDFLGRVDT